MIHYHNWRQFPKYSKDEFRCTTAKLIEDIAREPCADSCKETRHALHNLDTGKTKYTSRHYIETGCLGTCVYWKPSGLYTYAAPGLDLIEVEELPRTMLIDDEYLARLKKFNAQLARLAA